MIDPNVVAKFDRNNKELLEFWLFCLFVRGKNADIQRYKLEQFIDNVCAATGKSKKEWAAGLLFFANEILIENALRAAGSGQYTSLVKAIRETSVHIWKDSDFLRNCTLEDLESIPGVGPKTARYFLMNTRPDQRLAALDTHILQFLEAREGIEVPKSTPTGKRYGELEDTFLLIADFEGVSPVELDLAVWRASRERHPLAWREFMTEKQLA